MEYGLLLIPHLENDFSFDFMVKNKIASVNRFNVQYIEFSLMVNPQMEMPVTI
jgi:hypothetical protein